ncbi:MAG TPA: Xaa-Pro peptidase family protein [Gemmatimonadaceae bacterium]|nr:Xaa-Pro peptidase family protein [Gemmatimonadaceae bacterium]
MATDGSRALMPETLPEVQGALAEAGLDGWLLYDFRRTNPIAAGILGLEGMVTRRVFAYIPREGMPVAVTHAIEQGPWRDWPAAWRREVYSSWRTLEAMLAAIVGGRRVAMEYSPGDAVPYVDRVPAGVLDMVRAAGATVVSSAELVTRFYAVWGAAEIASHRRAAEVIAGIAHEAFAHAAGGTTTEHTLQQWILERFERAGLVADHGPIVAIGPNAANPHYEPTAEHAARIARGDVLLIDLFAREPRGMWADQTWMGVLGTPDARTITVWEAVRTARDAAIALLRSRHSPVRGGDVDDAARAVIVAAGFGEYFTHRTGHSIDARDLHGAGPHLDNLETRDDRLLLPGVAFSIEPGVYLPGVLGVRSEVNAVMAGPEGVLITPGAPQRELIIV